MLAPPRTPSASDAPPARPPHRPGWCRRHKFATFIVALLAAMLALRLTWGWYCAKELAAAWDEVRLRGDPTTRADLSIKAIPDRENAWIVYAQAAAAIKRGVESPRESTLEYSQYPPFGPKWHALAERSEKGNAAVFPIVRRARKLDRSQIPRDKPNQRIEYSAGWNQTRKLANTVADGAQYFHVLGNDAESIERLLDVFHLARSVRQDPAVIPQLIGIGIDALSLHAAQQIIPTLNLESSDGAIPASEAQARALISVLLDERESYECFSRALRRERVIMLNMLNDLARETWAIRPLADRTGVRWMHDFDILIAADAQRNAAAARNTVAQIPTVASSNVFLPGLFGGARPPKEIPRYSRWFERFQPGSLSYSLGQFHRVSAERRATAIIVAARLYRHKHGRWPDDAAALVPTYLDKLPADPFRANGGPIGYVLQKGTLPDGRDRPLVFIEAGEPGGKLDVIYPEPTYGWQGNDPSRKPGEPRREFRQYRDVSLWTPTTRRTVEYDGSVQETIDDDPDESDAPGDDSKQDDAADGPADQ